MSQFENRPTQSIGVPRVAVAALVLARSDSRRVPGKALLPVGAHSLTTHILTRVAHAIGWNNVWLATTTRPVDDRLVALTEEAGFNVFRGPCDDIAQRVIDCAETAGASHVLRCNGDSPLAPTELLATATRAITRDPLIDAVSNLPGRTYPYGITAEAIRVAALKAMLPELSKDEREHVTAGFYRRWTTLRTVVLPSGPEDLRHHRATVDEPRDVPWLDSLSEAFGDGLTQVPYTQALRTCGGSERTWAAR